MSLTYEEDEGIATIGLQSPPLNVLTWDFREAILRAVERAAASDAVRVIVVKSNDPRAFCAGADIREFKDSLVPGGGRHRCEVEHATYDWIEFQPKPTIGAINGYCLGGGLELAMAFDLRVCSSDAVFGQPEITLASFPGGGGTERLALAVGRARAKEIMWTGRTFGAAEAAQWGIVQSVVDPKDLASHVRDLALSIARHEPEPVRHIKELVDAADDSPGKLRGALPRVAPRVEELFLGPHIQARYDDFLQRR